MTISSFRHVVPALLMVLGLMTVALACGGASEAPQGAFTGSSDDAATADSASEVVREADLMSAVPTAAPQAASSESAALSASAQPIEGAGAVEGQARANRQLVIESRLGLEVQDIDAGTRQVESIAVGLGGWVESASVSGEGGLRTANVSVRVPSQRITDAMKQFRNMGRVVDEQVSATDVTERLVDNDARLSAWRVQEQRLISLLRNAQTVEDIVEIEKRISEVRTDIEVLSASQRNLEGRVATALIAVRLSLPGRLVSEAPDATLTLAVGDPSEVSESIRTRVNALGGYIGSRQEYQQGNTGLVVETAIFVRSTDLKGLMDYAATLGVTSGRNLNAVGDPPVGSAPDARLMLTIRSNSGVSASIQLESEDPAVVGDRLRARVDSLGGFVERFSERRDGDDHFVDMVLVVKSSDLREVLDHAGTLGNADGWQFTATGQQPPDEAPTARLEVSITAPTDYTVLWIVLGVVGGILIAVVVVTYLSGAWRGLFAGNPAPAPAPEGGDDDTV